MAQLVTILFKILTLYILGNAQTNYSFWCRVKLFFLEKLGHEDYRSIDSLGGQWRTLWQKKSKFNALFLEQKHLMTSGVVEKD